MFKTEPCPSTLVEYVKLSYVSPSVMMLNCLLCPLLCCFRSLFSHLLPYAAFPVLRLLFTSGAFPVPSAASSAPICVMIYPCCSIPQSFPICLHRDSGQSKHKDVTSRSSLIRSLLFLGQRAALLTHPIKEESLSKRLCRVTFRG